MLDRLKPFVKPFLQDDLMLSAIKKDGRARVFVAPFPYPAIVAGRASRIPEEVNLPQALSDNIPIFRRKGGGCSVYLDPGTLIVSMVFPAQGYSNIQMLFKKANISLIESLKKSGIKSISQNGISDIVIGDRKVGGSCFYRAKGIAYFTASILFSCDLSRMAKYLHSPPREPGYRNGRAHLDFVTTLVSHFKGFTIQSLADKLKINLGQTDLRLIS